ncbi:MAG: molecular chaperone TorD family protein, partial [Coriobacteriaceae bacterium]|nr:molecular chaperone TorD family protein [Coriobacteriaceae bacterium]
GHAAEHLAEICEAPTVRDANGDPVLDKDGNVQMVEAAFDPQTGTYDINRLSDEQLAEMNLRSGCVACKTTHFEEIYTQQGAAANDGSIASLRHDYVNIFVGPGTLKADPWESVHLSHTRALFQQELLPIRDAYRAAGFLPARYPHVQDDYIGLELDFLAKLAGAARAEWEAGNAAAAQERLAQSKAFLEEHLLLWIDSLAQAIEREYGDGFYARFTKLSGLIAKRDADILEALLSI